jgi:uncharacterized protein YqeY
MDTRQKLEDGLKDAMRSGDQTAKNVIRLVLTNLKFIEVDHGKQDESGVVALIHKEIKMRQESIHEAEKGERQDIIEKNEIEIKFLETFLPKQISEAELRNMVNEVIAQTGASSMKDMGTVMKALSARVQGQAPNNLVSQIVKELLSK